MSISAPSIPVIDLAAYQSGQLDDEQRAQLCSACEDHGFFLLSGHGADALVTNVFAEAERFFASPRELKLSVQRDETRPLGYYDRELTKQKRDQKEVFDFKTGGHMSRDPSRHTPWPAQDDAFQTTLTNFFATFTTLAEQTMRMVFESLGMSQTAADQLVEDGFGDRHTSSARLNFYPPHDPLAESERDGVTGLGDMALHHHTDPGGITLLLQDNHGGLQACSKRYGWIDVPPMPGAIVVNIGDVLQVWTNDRCTAGIHRVLPVRAEGTGRYSVPFFYQPRVDAQIEPWVGDGQAPRYRAFSWQEFIRGRVTDNFADYGSEDIQIERYRIA